MKINIFIIYNVFLILVVSGCFILAFIFLRANLYGLYPITEHDNYYDTIICFEDLNLTLYKECGNCRFNFSYDGYNKTNTYVRNYYSFNVKNEELEK